MKMFLKNKKLTGLLALGLFFITPHCFAQDSVAAVPVIKLHYYNINNSIQYLLLESNLKKGKVLTPQMNKSYDLFLDSSRAENMIGKITTDAEGKAKAFIPPALKMLWDAKQQHTFIVKEGEDEIINDYIISKSKIEIDTSSSDGVKNITVIVKKAEGNNWVPASDVEMKVGYKRLGGILPAGDEPTYTTDSSGSVTVEVKKDSLPGDEKGNIIIAASAEDNEKFGNLQIEKTVLWGTPTKMDKTFFEKRTLWTTRVRTPFWLMFMAYSIVIGVWGTLIYLVFQMIKVKKLAKSEAS